MKVGDENWPNCQCGCGLPATPYKNNHATRGHVKGAPAKFRARHSVGTVSGPLENHLIAHIDFTQGDCWVWTGDRHRRGYGFATTKTTPEAMAHRAVWRFLNGPVPEGLVLDHLCRNTSCVNPDHLEPVTQAENSRRGDSASITTAVAGEVKRLLAEGRTTREIHLELGVSAGVVRKIRRGEAWAGVEAA